MTPADLFHDDDGVLVVRWAFDDVDRARIAAGGSIWVALREGHVMVTSTDLVDGVDGPAAPQEDNHEYAVEPFPRALIDAPSRLELDETWEDTDA